MAIVQISQITNRLGLAADLPQLAGAELGWSTDTRQLFIGNGTLAEGAPVIGNTEILTEFSDILNVAASYTYKGTAAGYIVQTGPTPGAPVVQTLQSWMDQWASVKDFGATGDGVTDDTAAINRALSQLYCQQTNPQIRRALFFPAGVYRISSTLNIPTYATLYGEGPQNSIIQMVASGATGTHVAQTADSKQQVGGNIGTNGAITPQNITISNMAFTTLDDTKSILLVQSAKDCEFHGVTFSGPGTTGTLNVSTAATKCIDFGSTSSLVTTDILFNGCRFTGLVYGTYTLQQIKGVTFTNSKFDTLYQGVVLGQGTVVNGGPTGTRITSNIFDNIYAQGIIFGAPVSLNASGYNIFYDVANHFGGVINPSASVIDILGGNNVSIGDMFQRPNSYATNYPQVSLHNTESISTTNGSAIQLGTKTVQSGLVVSLDDAQVSAEAFTIDLTNNFTSATSFRVDYSIEQGTKYRTGYFLVTVTGSGAISFAEDYTENAATNIFFWATESAGIVSINYSTLPSSGLVSSMSYSISYFNFDV